MLDLKPYRHAVVLHKSQLKKLIAERENINRQIQKTTDLIQSNANFLPPDEQEKISEELYELAAGPLGITDAVRKVLSNNPRYFANALGVREQLENSGFSLGGYNNPLASIHTILKRLAARDEVEVQNNAGDVYYRWKGASPVIPKRRKAPFFGEY